MSIKKYFWCISILIIVIVLMIHFMRDDKNGGLEQRTESELEITEREMNSVSEDIRVLLQTFQNPLL